MTAEIAILNDGAIAVAADSTVTWSGAAQTIIEIYRHKAGRERHDTLEGYATGFLQFLDDNQTLFPEMAVTVQLHKNSEERRSEPVWIVVAWELSTLGDVPGSAASGTAKVDHERGHADALYSGALARPARLRGTLLGCPITKRPLNSDGHGDHTLPHGMGRRTSTREIIWRIGTSSFSGPYPCNAVTGLT